MPLLSKNLRSLLVFISCTFSNVVKCLDQKCVLRQLHRNTPNLQWDAEPKCKSQAYGEYLLATNSFGHDSKNKAKVWGRNLYWADNSKKSVCADAVSKW